MQLVRLDLNDFQAHEELAIDFGEGITTIKGATDVGKSAVLRALRWLCLNDFAGDEFIRYGAKEANVRLLLNTEDIIERSKGRHNVYVLESDEEDEALEFKAFGTGVPDRIRELLNVSEINFQAQHDAPFWFALSAPEVSRRLNAVIDLSVIDTSLSNIASEVRQAQERTTLIEERLKEAKTNLVNLESQRARITHFDKIKSLHEKAAQSKNDRRELADLIDRTEGYKTRAQHLSDQAEEGRKVLELARRARKAAQTAAELEEITNAVDEHQSAPRPPSFALVEAAHDERVLKSAQAEALVELVRSLEDAKLKAEHKRIVFESAEEAFHKKIKGSTCYVCGQTMK